MKIVHVVAKYPPSLGGLQKVVEVLAGMQLKRGDNVCVLTSNESYPGSKYCDPSPQLQVYRLKSINVAHTPLIFGLLRKLIQYVNRKDIVHLHIAQAFCPEIVWLASRIKRFSYIAHIHIDVAPSGLAGFLLKLYKPVILKAVLRGAARVIVFTEEQRTMIEKRYGIAPAKIAVLPNGIENSFYYPATRSPHKKLRLLFVGRLGVQKNLQHLLRVLEGVSEQFETTLVGSGELESELKLLAKKLCLKNIKFTGRADGEKLLNYYKLADLFVLTSDREGMPLVLLEAMAMALPVVATNVTGTRDVVKTGKNGLLVPLHDITAFRDALLRINADRSLYMRLAASASKLSKQYSWDKIVAKLDSLYQEVQGE